MTSISAMPVATPASRPGNDAVESEIWRRHGKQRSRSARFADSRRSLVEAAMLVACSNHVVL